MADVKILAVHIELGKDFENSKCIEIPLNKTKQKEIAEAVREVNEYENEKISS